MEKYIVVGFDILEYSKDYLNKLTHCQLHELALEDSNSVIFDSVTDFFNELNDDVVDVENMFYYNIKID